MLKDLDLKKFETTPHHLIHKMTHQFKNFIRKSLQKAPEVLNFSPKTIEKSESSEENMYLSSPKNSTFFSRRLSKSQKFEHSSTHFIAYRKFLGKAVPVIRRREFEPLDYEKISDIKLESPKTKIKKSLSTISITNKFINIAKKKTLFVPESKNHPNSTDYFFSNIKTTSLGKILRKDPFAIQYSVLTKKKTPTNYSSFKVFQENIRKKTKSLENKFKKTEKCEFLPARRRYKVLKN